MAQPAEESLLIRAEIDDQITGKLKELIDQTQKFGTEATKQFDGGEKAVSAFGRAGEIAAKKFEALGKAAIGIFTTDIAARVFGFSSALDVVQKASDAVASSIQHLLNPQLEEMKKHAEETAAALQKIVGAQDAIEKRKLANIFEVKGFSESFLPRLTGGPLTVSQPDFSADLRGLGGDLGLTDAALSKIRQTQTELNRLREAAVAASMTNDLQKMKAELSAIQKESDDAVTSLKAFLASLTAIHQEEASNSARRKAGLQGPPAPAGLDYFNVYGGGGGYNLPFVGHPDFVGPPSPGTPEYGGVFGGSDNPIKAQAEVIKEMKTSAAAAITEFERLTSAIADTEGQLTDVSFSSFRGFFNDVVTGAARGAEAFRRFAQSVVAGLADIIAQQLALRATGFLFGAFGGGGGTTPGATPMGTGIVGTGGPGSVPIGYLTASGGGGGGGMHVQVNVTTMDSRGVAEAVLGAMDHVSKNLQGRLAGSDRKLIDSVRVHTRA